MGKNRHSLLVTLNPSCLPNLLELLTFFKATDIKKVDGNARIVLVGTYTKYEVILITHEAVNFLQFSWRENRRVSSWRMLLEQ